MIFEKIINFLNYKNKQKYMYELKSTIHNYIDFNNNIIRKGAISAYKDEEVLIPLNMSDGSLLCTGLGNEDWNCSAPHGAGRILSRSKAKENIDIEEFKNSMKGIYTTSVSSATLDESKFAYKNKDDIITHIGETVKIKKILKPIYNFKSSS